MARDFSQSSSQFDAGRPAADDYELQSRRGLIHELFPLRQLKGEQNTPPNFQRIFD
jgi:hypothetical protein